MMLQQANQASAAPSPQPIQYQLSKQFQFFDGELQNISATDMSISLKDQAKLGEMVLVIIRAEETNEQPVVVNALVRDDVTSIGSSEFSYDCSIRQVWALN